MRWMQVIVIFIAISTTLYGAMSYPRKVLGFKHISKTHRPNCNCVTTLNGKPVPYVIEADALCGFVIVQPPNKKAVTLYGDVQIYPINVYDDYIEVLSKDEVNHLKRKFLLQGF